MARPAGIGATFRAAVTSLPVILAGTLLCRLGFFWSYQNGLSHQALRVIPFLFESGNIAHSLATGTGFASPFRVDTGPTAWTTPVYPLLLSGVMRIFGSYTFASYVAAVSLNILFSTLVAIPLFAAGKRIHSRGAAAAACWIWAIFPNAILLTYESLWETSLSALLGATLLWAALVAAETSRLRTWAAYGLLWGLTLMSNAALLSLLPFHLAWAAYRKRAWRGAALTVGVAALCCVPWTVRNYQVFGTFVPLRSILGLQLWVGNNPQAKVVWLGDQHPIHDSAERARYVEMGEIAYMRQKEHDALAYMATHPRHEAELIAGRFVSLWAGGSPSPVGDWMRVHSAWFRYVLLFNLAVAVGSWVGTLRLTWARSRFTIPAGVYPLVFPWAYYLTLSLPRYRHPIDPVLILLAVVAVAKGHSVPPGHGIDA